MKFGTDRDRIYIETKDYDDFAKEPIFCKRFISLEDAKRLQKELGESIESTPHNKSFKVDAENCIDVDHRDFINRGWCFCPFCGLDIRTT